MGKRLVEVIALLLLVLTGVSLTSGLELSASTGGNDGSSSMHVAYGATIDDYNYEHIGVSPADGTISNVFYGTGSLPFGAISRRDTKGNYAYVSRSVSGKPGITIWKYDWNIIYPVSTVGSGIGAWVSLTAGHAYSINGRGYASNSRGDVVDASINIASPYATASLTNYYANPIAFTNGVSVSQKADSASAYSITARSSAANKEGDNAQVSTRVGLSAPQTTSSISNYYNDARAYTNQVSASQNANRATSTYPIEIAGTSNNLEGDYAHADIFTNSGSINYPIMDAIATKTSDYVYLLASSIIIPGPVDKITPGIGIVDASVLNKEGDGSSFGLKVTSKNGFTGNILNPKFYALSQTHCSESKLVGLKSASGATAEIRSHAENQALAKDPTSGNSKKGGSADFKSLNTNGKIFTNPTVDARATVSDVTITPTGFTKTALVLEPFKWEWVKYGDLYGPEGSVGSYLEKKGYAVTDYSNAGVTWNKVYQLSKNTVSLINTHGWEYDKFGITIASYGLAISNMGDPNLGQKQSWEKLKPYLMNPTDKGKNDLMILDGCSTFFPNLMGLSGEDVAKNAQVSGGFKNSIPEVFNTDFMNTFFASLYAGDTAYTANLKAWIASFYQQEMMVLQGNNAYKLR